MASSSALQYTYAFLCAICTCAWMCSCGICWYQLLVPLIHLYLGWYSMVHVLSNYFGDNTSMVLADLADSLLLCCSKMFRKPTTYNTNTYVGIPVWSFCAIKYLQGDTNSRYRWKFCSNNIFYCPLILLHRLTRRMMLPWVVCHHAWWTFRFVFCSTWYFVSFYERETFYTLRPNAHNHSIL